MSEKLTNQRQRQSKELTPIQRLLMRELRVRGKTHQRIARLTKTSLQTVHAQTTALGIKPATSETERSLQLDLMRKRFSLESGFDLDGEIGARIWKKIYESTKKVADFMSNLSAVRSDETG